MIKTDKLDDGELTNLRRELKIMQSVSHPHVVKYIEAYEDRGKIYIVMELCKGGELL